MAKSNHSTHDAKPLLLIHSGQTRSPALAIVKTLIEETERRGWRLLDLMLSDGSIGSEKPIGAVLNSLPSDPMVVRLREMGCPVIRTGQLVHPDDQIVPAVIPDHEAAGRLAAEYFAERGFERMAMLAHRSVDPMNAFYDGFEQAARSLGCEPTSYRFGNISISPPAVETPAQRFEQRTLEFKSWLHTLEKPAAVVCRPDMIAGQLCVMCERSGISVPEEIAIMAVANRPHVCEAAPVPISALDIEEPQIARVAMQLLDDLIAGSAVAPCTRVAPSRVITRRSTDIVAVEHPLVAQAIRYVWDNLAADLSVGDVAQAMDVPRYKLQRLFRKHFDHGIHAELRRIRLEEFANLLRATDQTVEQLAPQVGFNSPKHLHNMFRKAYGVTPRKYRLGAEPTVSLVKEHGSTPGGV